MFKNAEVTFAGCLDGMSEKHPRGAYVGITITPDDGGPVIRVKVNSYVAADLAADILKNT